MVASLSEGRSSIDYDALIKEDRIHSSLYYDEAIFREELEQIWYKQWVFIGHDSEVPNRGDFRLGMIGRQPIIICRGDDDKIRVFMNRCRHRGMTLCQLKKGNSGGFVCPYHGWTYKNTGEVNKIPLEETYGNVLDRSSVNLVEVSRLDSYRGFLFASLSAEGRPLMDNLGLAKDNIDRFCAMSPTGEITLNHGVYRMTIRANWKMWIENSADGYHVMSTHGSNMYLNAMFGDENGKKQAGGAGLFDALTARDLGNGHAELDMRPMRRKMGMKATGEWDGKVDEKAITDYRKSMADFYGKERSEQILVDGPAHAIIFPNLFIILQELRWSVPVSPDETYIYYAPALLKGAPDAINTMRLREDEGAYGPAGFQLADDIEVWQRNYSGLDARMNEWILMSRGMGNETWVDDEGATVEGHLSELNQRTQWAHYKDVMTNKYS